VGSDGGTEVISPPSEAPTVDEAARAEFASTLVTNIAQTALSDPKNGSALPQTLSIQTEAPQPDAVIDFNQAASTQALFSTTPVGGEDATPKSEFPVVPQQFVPFVPIEPAPPILIPTETKLSRSESELDKASETFKKNYELFAAKNAKFLVVGDEFQAAFTNAKATTDIKRSAQIFGDGVWSTIQAIENKQAAANIKWTSKVGNFLAKLYPVAILTMNLAVAGSDVSHFSQVC
jgi:hypothetical protein